MTNMYAAGLFDGEGTVTLVAQSAGRKRVPTVSLSSTSYELVQFMKEHYNGHIIQLTPKKEHHKQAWHWQASFNAALSFLEQVSPYLLELEKKRRADLLLSRYKSVTPRNGKYTPEMLIEREAFEAEFFKS